MIISAERSDDGILIRCALDSTPDSVSAALRAMRTELEDRAAPAVVDGLPWELVVAEVLNNIVEHAYRNAPTGRIRARLDFQADRLRAEFTDHGHEMPGLTPPEGRAVNVNVAPEAVPEGGFGWFLIRSLTSDLCYQRRDGANHLSLSVTRTQDT